MSGPRVHTHTHTHVCVWASQVLVVKNVPASAGDTGDMGLVRGSGRSLGIGNANPVQYSCLGKPLEHGGLQSMGLQRVGNNLGTE